MSAATATRPSGKATRAQKVGKIAASIKALKGDSTIASLEGRTTTEAAQAPRADGLKVGNNFTGQYLYDRLVGNNQEEITKMDMVRQMVKAVDTASFKKLMGDFVAVAKGYMDNAITKHGKDAPEAVQPSARYKTAQNHQTVLRIAYGALKFASDQLDQLGYDAKVTGYQTMRVIGLKALTTAGVKWDGTKAEEKEVRDARLENKAEADAIAQVMATIPRNEGESLLDYLTRIDEAVENTRKAQAAEKHAELVKRLAEKVRKDAGSMLDEVLDYIAASAQADEPGTAE